MKVPPLEIPLEDVRKELEKIRHPLRIAIERAKNPFNIGAIIRTAHSFLVREIYLIGTEPWYERAAMGMHRFENIVEVPTTHEFIAQTKAAGRKILVFEKDYAEANLWDAEIPDESVMVFGNEDTGASPEMREAADQIIGIPMFGLNHSYPITVAAGIAMAEWARRYYQGGRFVITKKS